MWSAALSQAADRARAIDPGLGVPSAATSILSAAGWSRWRAMWRMSLLPPTLAATAVMVCLASLLPMRSARRTEIVNALITRASRRVLRICNVRVRVVGRRPDEPVLFACNHLSWIDILAAKIAWPDAQFIAKRDVARWPVVGVITRAVGTLYVDRLRRRDLLRAIPAVRNALASGTPVVLFAEGTTTDGSETLPFKSSLFEAAVRAQVPVVPVTFRAHTGRNGVPVATHVCWWGETSLLAHVPRVAGTHRIEFTIRIGEPIMPGICRKGLARAAHKAVQSKARHGTRT